jgi:hypothetical protein
LDFSLQLESVTFDFFVRTVVDFLFPSVQLALVITQSSAYLFGWFAMIQVVFHM